MVRLYRLQVTAILYHMVQIPEEEGWVNDQLKRLG